MSVWAGRSFGTLLCEKNSVSVCKFCEVSRKSSKNKPKARSTVGTVFPDSSFSVKHWRLKQGDIQDEVTADEVFPSVAHSHAHYHKHLSKHNNDHVTLQVISCVLLFPLGVVIFHFECARVLRGVTVCRRESEREERGGKLAPVSFCLWALWNASMGLWFFFFFSKMLIKRGKVLKGLLHGSC